MNIAEFNSADIRAIGATAIRCIGGGYVEGYEGQADYYIGFYALQMPNGLDIRVANTNGDPIWEEADAQAFADLAESCGVEI